MGNTCNSKSSQASQIKFHSKGAGVEDQGCRDPSHLSSSHEKTGRPEFDEWEALSPGSKLQLSSKLSMKARTASTISASGDRAEIRFPMLPNRKKLTSCDFEG